MRILVVDDIAPIVRSMTVMLEKAGWEVMGATSVDAAVNLVPHVDVVLTDYDMPDGGGRVVLDACARYRKPVVVHSATDKKTIGHPFIVEKPAFFEDVLRTVRDAMNASGR